MLEVKEWDTGKPLGKIAQVENTYSVVGNMNEHQVAITESTFADAMNWWIRRVSWITVA